MSSPIQVRHPQARSFIVPSRTEPHLPRTIAGPCTHSRHQNGANRAGADMPRTHRVIWNDRSQIAVEIED